jgi:hypothetical protein
MASQYMKVPNGTITSSQSSQVVIEFAVFAPEAFHIAVVVADAEVATAETLDMSVATAMAR